VKPLASIRRLIIALTLLAASWVASCTPAHAAWTCTQWGTFTSVITGWRDRGVERDDAMRGYLRMVVEEDTDASVVEVPLGLNVIDAAYKLRTMRGAELASIVANECRKQRSELEARR
jgi:hypothetical protein